MEAPIRIPRINAIPGCSNIHRGKMGVLPGYCFGKRSLTGGADLGPCLYYALVFNLLLAGFFLASGRAFACDYMIFDEVIAMSQNGDYILTCDYPRKGNTCSIFQRSDPQVATVIHNFGDEVEVENLSLFHKAYTKQKKEIIKKAQKYLNEEYPEKKIKLGWHGKNALTSPDDSFEIEVSGDFFSFLYIVDKKTQIKYPVFATAGASACDWEEVPKLLFKNENELSLICLKKALWQKNKLILIIGGEHHCGYQEFIYEIKLGDLKEDNLEQIRKEFLFISTLLANDQEAKKLSEAKDIVLWSLPWGRKLNYLADLEAFEKTVILGDFREKMFRPLAYFLLADQINTAEPKDYYRMIKETLKIMTSLELSPGFWGKKFSTVAKEPLEELVNKFLLAIRSQLPGEKARETAEKILKSKKLTKELQDYDGYKILVEAFQQLESP